MRILGETDSDPLSWAGHVAHHRARETGGLVVLVRSLDAGIEADPSLPYAVVCDRHATCVCGKRREMTEAMAHPTVWCEGCREGER